MSRKPIIFTAIFIACLTTHSCSWPESNEMVQIGPDVKASMVIYYKAGVNEDQINYFLQNVIGRPDPEGRGYYHRDGIIMVLRVYPSVQGHEATAITLSDKITQVQRDEIKKEIISSPIVYKVLENIVPADVKKLD